MSLSNYLSMSCIFTNGPDGHPSHHLLPVLFVFLVSMTRARRQLFSCVVLPRLRLAGTFAAVCIMHACAGDAFPPLAHSPDPNFQSTPNSARGFPGGNSRGLRSSTSRIPRPANAPPPSARGNELRQSMPTFPSQRKYGPRPPPGFTPPYRPSGRTPGGGPPSTRSNPAQRNLASRWAALISSLFCIWIQECHYGMCM